MGYRDDREALIGKLRALEAELEHHRESERHALANDIDTMRTEVEGALARVTMERDVLIAVADRLTTMRHRIDSEANAPRPPPPEPPPGWPAAAVAFALVAAVGAGAWAFMPYRGVCARHGCAMSRVVTPCGGTTMRHIDSSIALPIVPALPDVPDVRLEPTSASSLPGSTLRPETPTRTEIRGMLSELREGVDRCGRVHGAEEGVLIVRMSLDGATGRPFAVRVAGSTDPVGACVREAVVDSVQVPPFQRPSYLVTYPFRIGSHKLGDGH